MCDHHNTEMEGVKPDGYCPVSSHNEWDPLEEVIIGNVNGAIMTHDDTENIIRKNYATPL